MWRTLRVTALLAILLIVASVAWLDQRRVHAWRQTLDIGIYPLAADASPLTRQYVARLARDEFLPLEAFFAGQARAYGIPLDRPVRVEFYPGVAELPPVPPTRGGLVATAWWSLRLRYFAARAGAVTSGRSPSIRVFAIYHNPALSPQVPDSSGLAKGFIGVAHLFAVARMSGSNNVVLAHEILHTLGATDKYDPASNAPQFPAGFGDPGQVPRYPQRFAEIMAGRRALSATAQEMPASLDDCVVGAATAAEIHWVVH